MRMGLAQDAVERCVWSSLVIVGAAPFADTTCRLSVACDSSEPAGR